MKPSVFLASFATALLLSPVLASAQTQDTAPNPPMPRRQGSGGPGGGQMQHPGPGSNGTRQAHPGMGMREKRQSMKEALGLTEAQQIDLRKVRETATRDRLRKGADLKIASMDLKSLMRADKVDDKAIAAKLAEVQAARGALLKIRVDGALAMKRILTPEQQKKMAGMRGHGAGRRMHRRMNGRGAMGSGAGRGHTGRPSGRGGRGRGAGDEDLDLHDDEDNRR